MLTLVIVTYNRLAKLQHALASYDGQTQMPDCIIVVDNHSTDGTALFLQEWSMQPTAYRKEVIQTHENLGGAGGFYQGQRRALELGSDWVYVADDDAYASPDMIERFHAYINSHDCANISAVCSMVLFLSGEIDYGHRDLFGVDSHLIYQRKHPEPDSYEKESFEINIFSYVGTFLNANALRHEGLVDPSFFIFYDDTEHSLRLSRWGRILCVPSIIVYHEGGGNSASDDGSMNASWRDYYSTRNLFVLLRRHYFFASLNYFRIYLERIYWYRCETGLRGQITRDAFWDAYMGRLGKNGKYLPGVSLA